MTKSTALTLLHVAALAGLAGHASCRHAYPLASLPYARMELAPHAAAAAPAATAPAPAPAAAVAKSPQDVAAVVTAVMDKTADPCQDFYRYACGGWLDTTKLPGDKSRWGRAFSEIAERNQAAMRAILEESAKGSSDPDHVKVGRYYGSCIDEAAIEKAGAEPLKPWLARIAKVDGPKTAMTVGGELQGIGVNVLFSAFVHADFKNPDLYVADFSQGGLGLPDRDYYLKGDDDSKQLRIDYQAHVARMLELSGVASAQAKEDASQAVAFETALARVSLPRAELRDPEKRYNKLDIGGLKELTPKLDWDGFLRATGYPAIKDINVSVPTFFTGLSDILQRTEPAALRSYLRWQLVHDRAADLSKAFVDEDFAFFGARLGGRKELEPRWKRCVDATDGALGELLGKIFVERHFAGDSKTIALTMIRGIEDALSAGLPALSWMDDPTRARAVEKMRAITNKIGYPDAWRDYSSMKVVAGDYFANASAARRFEFERQAGRIGGRVDRKEWLLSPPTVNAYYLPTGNEIVFPAGVLQEPFFHKDYPAPMNFGGIGMVMGHEITHGFDDIGRKFDGTGRLTEWWEPAVAERFQASAKCVDDLYTSYEPQPGLHLNGKLTLGENIADLGGIKQAYRAWKAWEKEHPGATTPIAGLTNDQLFFVGFAQTWCTLETPEIQKVLATVDPHSPPRFRVNGPLANYPTFAETFSCAAGTPMRSASPCEVW